MIFQSIEWMKNFLSMVIKRESNERSLRVRGKSYKKNRIAENVCMGKTWTQNKRNYKDV